MELEKLNSKDFLRKKVIVEINIPLGSKYPIHKFIPNTTSGGGEKFFSW